MIHMMQTKWAPKHTFFPRHCVCNLRLGSKIWRQQTVLSVCVCECVSVHCIVLPLKLASEKGYCWKGKEKKPNWSKWVYGTTFDEGNSRDFPGLAKVSLEKGCYWGGSSRDLQAMAYWRDVSEVKAIGRLNRWFKKWMFATRSGRSTKLKGKLHVILLVATYLARPCEDSRWQWQCQHSSNTWCMWIAQNPGPND